MNILLIYPQFPDTFWSFSYALRFIGKKSAFPPLGLITVAALLPEQFQTRLVDLNVDALGDDDLAWADMAFISAMAVQRESAGHVIGRCKAKGLIDKRTMQKLYFHERGAGCHGKRRPTCCQKISIFLDHF